jgi:serine/threonine-protein kinase
MGVVFATEHLILCQEVALKVLGEAIATPEAVRRFLNEGRAAASIQGEHVARVHDIGLLEDGRPFICMELLAGEDLAKRLEREGPLSPKFVADCLLEALEALAQAHAMGIVHRDLKPSNLFLARRPDGGHVLKVLDFGIAKAVGGDPRWQLNTATKTMVGSPLYMAPEQVRKSKTADPQSDIWAVGAMAYELLCGAPPFHADELGELFLAIVETTPRRVETRRAGIPRGLGDVVTRCLEKDRKRRFGSVAELATALAPFASPLGAVSAERVAATMLRAGTRSGVNSSIVDPPSVTPPEVEAPRSALAVSATLPSSDPGGHAGTKQTWSKGHVSQRRLGLLVGAALLAGGAVAIVLGVRAHHAAPAGTSAASASEATREPPPVPTAATVVALQPAPPADSAAASAQPAPATNADAGPSRPPRPRQAPGPAPAKSSSSPLITNNKDLF